MLPGSQLLLRSGSASAQRSAGHDVAVENGVVRGLTAAVRPELLRHVREGPLREGDGGPSVGSVGAGASANLSVKSAAEWDGFLTWDFPDQLRMGSDFGILIILGWNFH